jgi:hypothetical protein
VAPRERLQQAYPTPRTREHDSLAEPLVGIRFEELRKVIAGEERDAEETPVTEEDWTAPGLVDTAQCLPCSPVRR